MTPIRHLRWYIGGLLFLSTVINYIDRQTLSVLAPYLKAEYPWTNTDFAWVLIAFRVAYAVGQTLAGRIVDRLGTRRGLSLAVAWYSVAAMATSLAGGLRSFCAFRFALGLGEAANWPGATKAVSEWFPRRESGWAVALFDSGSSIGAAVAPFIVLGLYHSFGSWRPAFVITGTLGFLWLLLFLLDVPRARGSPAALSPKNAPTFSRTGAIAPRKRPARHASCPTGCCSACRRPGATSSPRPSRIRSGSSSPTGSRCTWCRAASSSRRAWPVSGCPFLAADLGNFFGGGVSSLLISRGWRVGAARKAIAVFGGLGMTFLIPTVYTESFLVLVGCFAIATFAYAAFSTVILNLPADIYPTGSVASVSGLGGTAAGAGTIAAIYLTGWVSDRYSFAPILLGASVLPLVGMAAMLLLVRNTEESRAGIVNEV